MARYRKRRGRKNNDRGGYTPRESDDKLYFEGEVEEALPNTMFRVRCDNGMQVLTTLAGKMRRFRIRVLPGDRVSVEVSAYDPTRGRLTYRHRTPPRREVA
ncbi:MAG: translation initiation factor IF-1 [Myxococcales bacterium]|nr:translation initiation factor IF-1 [Myxococcales bacterium]